MRQRITYLHNATEPFDPSSLKVTDHSFTLHSLKSAREARVTFGFHELPQEVYELAALARNREIRSSFRS